VTSRPPSGEQHVLEHGAARAVVTEVGATLRSCTVDGLELVDGFDVDARAHDGRGQVLVPWPNRITDGRYRYGARDCQAPLNEPARHDAIHGLVRWLDWAAVARDGSSVSLACRLRPQPGYEWDLDLLIRYQLTDDGLGVTLEAVNVGPEPAPFGAGFHPYLAVGPGSVDDADLTVPATHVLDPDADGGDHALVPVAGSARDFTEPRRLGGERLDTAYAGLIRGADGRARAVLRRPGGDSVELWVDEAFGYLMVYTADEVGDPARRRGAVAIEPMTCPPEAFRTGTGVVDLAPGASWTGAWGLRSVR
jgi:aldose 1-epimerase